MVIVTFYNVTFVLMRFNANEDFFWKPAVYVSDNLA
jgi:hypothetical protein